MTALNFEKYASKGNALINEIAVELVLTPAEGRNKAARSLRAVLHVLRRLIPVEESLQLLAQLPMCLKAIYVDGWKPLEPPLRVKHIEDFALMVMEEDGRAAISDFQSQEEVLEAVHAVFTVLKRHVTPGEIEDIRGSLPKELKTLLDD